MSADILYISFDGVLQPLPFSQVVRVVSGLGRRGLRYHLLSLERPKDLEQVELRDAVVDMLRPPGVAWTHVASASMRSARLAAQAVARVTARAAGIVRREGIQLVHARGYHSALVALALKQSLGVPYLFDARGFWIEERSGPGGLFSRPTAYAVGKLVEQLLFRNAEAVVTLTELQAEDVAAGLFGAPPRLLEVIPTCADYDAFYLRDSRPAKPVATPSVPVDVQRRLERRTVIGIVGALNGTYFVTQSLEITKRAMRQNPAVHLLVLSAQRQEYATAVESLALPPERYTISTATHWTMPEWLQWLDWGLLLVPETQANRAKMPTKLAEFFASGVRPVFFGCNADAARWVERAGSGHVLRSTTDAELDRAAHAIAELGVDCAALRSARETTAPHFSLSSGLDRYVRLLEACVPPRRPPLPAAPEDLARRRERRSATTGVARSSSSR
jgi:hypothetical protein